jgi:hypothetical protein
MKRLIRELLYGEIRTVIQISAFVVSWLLWNELDAIGETIVPLLIFSVWFALEIVRVRRFRRLYAEAARRLGENKPRLYLLFFVFVVAVFTFEILSHAYFKQMDSERLRYVLWGGITLWDELWLAHRRYQAD